MIIKNVVIEGIERVEGKRKADGQPFGFWKLYGLGEFQYKKNTQGQQTYVFTMNDDKYQNSTVTLGSMVDLYVKGSDVCEFVCESA